MDIGKSIAGFHFTLIGVQLAECVWVLATQGLSDFPLILRGLFVAVFVSYLALKFWRHDDELRRWMVTSCKIAYVGFPLIVLFGLLAGGPMSINFPFVHTKTDSPVVILGLLAGALVYAATLHLLLTSKKATAEFTRPNGLSSTP